MCRRPEHPLFRLAAWVMAFGVLLLALAAVSPALHAQLHRTASAAASCDDDAPVGSADHVCAVTLFAQALLGAIVVLLVFLARLVSRRLRLDLADLKPADHPWYRLVPAHAPPAA